MASGERGDEANHADGEWRQDGMGYGVGTVAITGVREGEVVRSSLTVSGLAKVAIFTTNVDAENQTLINHKCVCGALNRHFCQTRVMGWASFRSVCPACFHYDIVVAFNFVR